jgi:hypothetical protein
MRRPALILLAAVVVVACTFFACYFAVTRWHAMRSDNWDDLAWLRAEFRLSDAELGRIRMLHEAYRPQCEEMCARIAAKNTELVEVLAGATNVTPAAESKLAESAALQAQCRANMLRHFYEVSQAMPTDQGRRYLAEMQRLTLSRPMPFAHLEPDGGDSLHVHPRN